MQLLRLPGLIDVHVHLRDPSQTHKEDMKTGSEAALAGGFTTIIDMPNNKRPTTTLKRLKKKINISRKKALCDVGFYAGSLGKNLEELMKMEPYVYGLKLYLNQTTGNFIIDEEKLKKIFTAWKSKKPILVHAESNIIEKVVGLAVKMKKRIHICHVSSALELKQIIKAKKKGYRVTCGVTPHHLFLTDTMGKKLGPFGAMKPSLKPKKDVDFLWKHLKDIDVIESDHAPHTIKEKKLAKPPFGVPGLETTLPLLLTAVSNGKLTIKRLKQLCFDNPKKIFNIKTDKNTYIEVDDKKKWVIDNKKLKTKCGWSPFHGWKMEGKVSKVYVRGKLKYVA